MTKEARAMIAEGRKHDEAMTDAPWEWDHDCCVGPATSVDYGMGPEIHRETIIETDGGHYGPEGPDRAGITWLRTNLASLLEGYASALDEIEHWREARRIAIEGGEILKAELDDLRNRVADVQREAGMQALVIEQQDLDMARVREGLTNLRDALVALPAVRCVDVTTEIDAILQGAPCTEATK